MSPDHIPSFASIKRMLSEQGVDLTPGELRAIRKNTTCVVVQTCDHITFSRTFGGRNSTDRIALDAGDLYKAATADLNAWEPVWRANGWTQTQIDTARELVHDMNRELFSNYGILYGNF